MLKRFVLPLLLSGLIGQAAVADQLTEAKYRDIEQLMEITGSANLVLQFADAVSQNMYRAQKALRPDIPERTLEVMHRELVALLSEKVSAPGGLLELTVPIYDKYFTHSEIRELLAFYQSPIGQKSVAVMPMALQESMEVGERWGQSLGLEIQQRVVAALVREQLLLLDEP